MLCMTVYALHKTILPMAGSEFAKGHLHDLMAMPILLGWIDLIVDHESKAGRFYGDVRFSIALTVAATLNWEVLWPAIDPNSWGDPVDAVCYAIGSASYLAIRSFVKNAGSRQSRKTS
jgi:hypothetical protein